MMVTMGAKAQKIQTVDKDGQPIPYASIIAEDGKFIGTTDLNGVLNDVKVPRWCRSPMWPISPRR